MGLALNSEEVQQNLALLPAAADVSVRTHRLFIWAVSVIYSVLDFGLRPSSR